MIEAPRAPGIGGGGALRRPGGGGSADPGGRRPRLRDAPGLERAGRAGLGRGAGVVEEGVGALDGGGGGGGQGFVQIPVPTSGPRPLATDHRATVDTNQIR